MDNRINTPVPSVPPRQAEQSDTRQALRHFDPEERRRRKKREPGESETDEDSMEVSIEALLVMLDDAVASRRARRDHLKRAFTDMSLKAANGAGKPASPQAARAANAYATQAGLAGPEKQAAAPGTGEPDSDLSAEERRELSEIETLQMHLRDLYRKGISHLPIDQRGSFLQALQKAVFRAQTEL